MTWLFEWAGASSQAWLLHRPLQQTFLPVFLLLVLLTLFAAGLLLPIVPDTWSTSTVLTPVDGGGGTFLPQNCQTFLRLREILSICHLDEVNSKFNCFEKSAAVGTPCNVGKATWKHLIECLLPWSQNPVASLCDFNRKSLLLCHLSSLIVLLVFNKQKIGRLSLHFFFVSGIWMICVDIPTYLADPGRQKNTHRVHKKLSTYVYTPKV